MKAVKNGTLEIRSTVKKAFDWEVDQSYIENDTYIGTGHFLIDKKYVCKQTIKLRDSESLGDIYIHVSPKEINNLIPKQVISNYYFIPEFSFYSTNLLPVPYVTDGKVVFNARYYWYICMRLKLRLLPTINGVVEQKKAPWAIINDENEIVGALMPVNPDVLNIYLNTKD